MFCVVIAGYGKASFLSSSEAGKALIIELSSGVRRNPGLTPANIRLGGRDSCRDADGGRHGESGLRFSS
jgi:hypothetical protein